jgi:hypothetical protein
MVANGVHKLVNRKTDSGSSRVLAFYPPRSSTNRGAKTQFSLRDYWERLLFEKPSGYIKTQAGR